MFSEKDCITMMVGGGINPSIWFIRQVGDQIIGRGIQYAFEVTWNVKDITVANLYIGQEKQVGGNINGNDFLYGEDYNIVKKSLQP